ncbi:MAG: hypothetical protein AAGE05_08510 [Pseudomonadota bacterium]
MKNDSANSLAAAAVSFAAAAGAIFSPYFARFDSISDRLVLLALSTIGLFTIFEILRWLILRWHYRKLLGRWYYASREHDGLFSDRNVATMDFKLSMSGRLDYVVHLYEGIEDLEKALDPAQLGGAKLRGKAESMSLRYDVGKNEVYLVFFVEYYTDRPEDLDRLGRLKLVFTQMGRLSCEYLSEIWELRDAKQDRGLSSGRMFATRDLEDLRTHIASWTPDRIDHALESAMYESNDLEDPPGVRT